LDLNHSIALISKIKLRYSIVHARDHCVSLLFLQYKHNQLKLVMDIGKKASQYFLYL